MTAAPHAQDTGPQTRAPQGTAQDRAVRLVPPARSPEYPPPAKSRTAAGRQGHSPAASRTMPSWPLLILAIPAAIAVWSGWIGIGQLTDFGQIHPLPGIWNNLHLDTAATLPVGVEAYAAYALRAWLTTSTAVSARTRQFARHSAIGSLALGMAGQTGYHLLAQAHAHQAPWTVTTAVSCLPVLVLGMGTALAHLLHADHASPPTTDQAADRADHGGTCQDQAAGAIRAGRLTDAQAAAALVTGSGQRVSRRTLRAAGLRGSNAHLGNLARAAGTQPAADIPDRA